MLVSKQASSARALTANMQDQPSVLSSLSLLSLFTEASCGPELFKENIWSQVIVPS